MWSGQASIPYELKLEPLPCWSHWPPERHQRQIAEILKQIGVETAKRHQLEETAPLGVEEILAQHPHASPNRIKRAPAPLVHAASRRMRRVFYRAYAVFVGAFYEAVERLKDGRLEPGLPDGAFPPPQPLAAPGYPRRRPPALRRPQPAPHTSTPILGRAAAGRRSVQRAGECSPTHHDTSQGNMVNRPRRPDSVPPPSSAPTTMR